MSLPINPETKVGALLDGYPGIEQRLIAWVPAFVKLKNPVLRRTVAKVMTLEQAARVGGIEVRELVRKLREETGQGGEELPSGSEPAAVTEPPGWLDESRVRHEIDAESLLSAGEHPLGKVRQCAAELAAGEIVRVASSFPPVPLIDALRRGGFAVYSTEAAPGRYVTYIWRE